MQNQLYVFLIFILNGFLIGIIFDIFRIFRKSFKTPDFLTYLEDISFWIFTGIILLYSILKFNNGELRVYIFIGIIVGLIFYFIIFSKIFIKISVNIIILIKKILYTIIIIPLIFIFKWVRKIFCKPVIFICISTKKNLSKIKRKFIFLKKKHNCKKDFT